MRRSAMAVALVASSKEQTSKIPQGIPEGEYLENPDEAETFLEIIQISETSLRMHKGSKAPHRVGRFLPIPIEA